MMSPGGIRFPSTPKGVAAIQSLADRAAVKSNEKVNKEMDEVKKKDVEERNDEVKDDVKIDAEVKDEDAVNQDEMREWYERKMKGMEYQLKMLEQVMENNEMRFAAQLEDERRLRRDADRNRQGEMERMIAEVEHREFLMQQREKRAEKEENERTRMKVDGDEEDNVFESEMSISDPAGDVLADLSMCRVLEKGLRNDRNSVSTVASLYDSALKRHDELKEILDCAGSFSVKHVVHKFKNKFRSLYKISKTTLSVIGVMAMAEISPAKAKAAVNLVASKDSKSLQRAVPVALKSGSVPVVEVEMKSKPLTQLPGIKQLLGLKDEKSIEEHWDVIESFVLCVVGHVKDLKHKLKVAKQELSEVKGIEYDEIEDMLADFNAKFDACNSWLGAEFEVTYEKVQRFVSKCPPSVKIEYAEFVSPSAAGGGVDEMKIDWEDFEELIRKVWDAALIKSRIREELGVGIDKKLVPYVMKAVRRAPAAADIDTPMHPPSTDGFAPIVCKTCEKSFMPSTRQVERLKEHGIQLSDECPKCKGQVCDKFREDGACPYGDDCKFLHPTGDVPTVPTDGLKKHSYSCRFFATGHCMSGDKCRFQHGPPIVHSISEVDPSVYNMSEVESLDQEPEDESLAVEVYKGRFDQSGRWSCQVDASKYRYV